MPLLLAPSQVPAPPVEGFLFDGIEKPHLTECRRVLKPKGSAVFIFQPNYEKLGQMRLWLWEFMAWAGRKWNLIQDVYWWATDALPLAGTNRKHGLMRQSVKMCVWLGPADCYRNQDAVLWTPSQAMMAKHRTDFALRIGPNGRTYRNGTIAQAADERGGTTPFNVLPIPTGGRLGGAEHHPAATPYDVAAWWCRYILPAGGVLSRSILRQWHDAGGWSRPRCQPGHRHRQREEVSGDCEAADHIGLKYHRTPSRSATRTILASTNAVSKSSTNCLGKSTDPRS